ncbi:MAG TPA: c-type cytochrome biogenesis protein CcmI [Bradyrhizobium sp.]|jgi:cytochrome c-type biogenesis protein CcmH|nr:c-type cytochrome biogenesis protein CcmI [Bradyrhizobium sp.]
MILWPILTLMTLGAVIAVWWPFARRPGSVRSGSDIAVYRDQLDEIDRDQAASLIGNVEAEAARVEVSRRLIAAAGTAKARSVAPAPGPAGWYRRATLAAAIVLLPVGAGAVYLSLGSPGLVSVSMNASTDGRPLPAGIEHTVAEVETYMESNPRNGRGWELLAPVYLRLGRFDDAVRARRNTLEIFGPDAAHLGDLGEAMVMASGGAVTAEAKSLFERANAADPDDVMAQYYLGLGAKQDGRRDEAEKRWRALVSRAGEGAEWLPVVKDALARIDEKSPSVVVAAPASGAAKVAPKGPSAREVAAAAQLAPAERNGMIEGMVARLAQKMAENGSDVEGWLRLIKAYSVLGERDKALTAAANARSALAGNNDNLRRIGELAKELGLEGS